MSKSRGPCKGIRCLLARHYPVYASPYEVASGSFHNHWVTLDYQNHAVAAPGTVENRSLEVLDIEVLERMLPVRPVGFLGMYGSQSMVDSFAQTDSGSRRASSS